MSDLFDVSKETILITTDSATPGVGAESDLDGAILLLASRASRYMTGKCCDGGWRVLLN